MYLKLPALGLASVLFATMSDDTQCMICCESFTKSVRKKVECGHCGTSACAACFAQYLLSLQGEPHCMNNDCRHAFDREFLAMHMTKTWLLTKYKAHRERVLLEREMALLPASQEVLQNYKYAQVVAEQMDAVGQRRRRLQQELADLNVKHGRLRLELDVLRASNYARRAGGETDGRDRRQFVRACPMPECRGFLSTAWKCGTCDSWACKDCGEPKPGGQHDPQHACDQGVKASFALLQRDSRPCPQCASMIFKIDGCFGEDVPVRMWDGGVKMSQDIMMGDVLIGDDGLPRTVLDTFAGEGELFRVDQERGMSYVVNSKHTLLFRFNGEGVYANGDGFKVSWLGRESMAFHSKEFAARDNAEEFFETLNLRPEIEMTVDDYLKLPPSRLKSLVAWKCPDVTTRELKNIALKVHGIEYPVKDYKTQFVINVFGKHMDEVPTRIVRKRCAAATPNKDELATGFTVTPIGKGRYYGWMVDGNKRFLLEDFTVVRNCDQVSDMCARDRAWSGSSMVGH